MAMLGFKNKKPSTNSQWPQKHVLTGPGGAKANQIFMSTSREFSGGNRK